jgi:hypothetical protein
MNLSERRASATVEYIKSKELVAIEFGKGLESLNSEGELRC